jgi:hypothetical protein
MWGDLIEGTAPTCTETGSGIRTCTLNNLHTENRIIAARGHDEGEWHITKEAESEADGTKVLRCTRDNFVLDTGNIEALGHDWNGWEISTINISKKTCSRCTEKNNGKIGDTGPGGGKIFYVLPTGFSMTDDNSTAYYLEASPSDMQITLTWNSPSCIPYYLGGTGDSYIYIFGTESAIGTGRFNTALILSLDPDAPAAKACSIFNNNGVADWFLPSIDELNELYERRNIISNLITTSTSDYSYCYWSSQSSSYGFDPWAKNFSNGIQGPWGSENKLSVRAIRAF